MFKYRRAHTPDQNILEPLLERERLFREEFSHGLMREMRQFMEETLTRERLFREEFSHGLMREMRTYIDERIRWHMIHTIAQPYPDDGALYIHTNDGHRFFLDARETFISLHVMEHGEWEKPVRDVMRRILKSGGVFVDIGANIGLHTVFAAMLVGASGTVYAVEPHPRTFGFLCRNIDINGMQGYVQAKCLAVSDAPAQSIEFEYFPQHPAMSGFSLPQFRLDAHHGTPEKIMVQTTTIDTLLAPTYHADLIKIDVEGFERIVLQGASQTIAHNQDACFIIEFDHKLITSTLGDQAVAALIDIFKNAGYVAYVITHDKGLQPLPYDTHNTAQGDVLYVHPTSRHYPSINA
jgi:FkbM family methyltransferase